MASAPVPEPASHAPTPAPPEPAPESAPASSSAPVETPSNASPEACSLKPEASSSDALDARLSSLDKGVQIGLAPGEKRIVAANLRKEGMNYAGFEFGPYRILGEIARGAMGVLFRAKQAQALADPKVKLPEEVALKVILARQGSALAKAADVERFIREIRVLITLSHPNIVRIWDAGKENGLHYYTMELIRGDTLKDLVRDRPMPLVMALAVVREIASALDMLHQNGMLHRDVKPANILMDRATSPYRAVLIDFGLIKGKFAGTLTAGAGEVAGTPAYMAPEATEPGREVGPPSDLYALGAVLYYLLTRRSPFVGTKAEEILEQVRKETPKAPRSIVRDLPRPVEAILMRCLEKRPEDRPGMAALIAALDAEIRGARRSISIENALLRYRRKIFG
jgi:serine/threonine protein kinase